MNFVGTSNEVKEIWEETVSLYGYGFATHCTGPHSTSQVIHMVYVPKVKSVSEKQFLTCYVDM